MSIELVVFPDVVVATLAALTDRLPELGYTGVSAVGWIPKPRPARFVRVLRVGGVADGLVVDDALVVVEAWAGSAYESSALAQACRAVVHGMAGQVIDGVTVYTVTESGGLANLPDPESDQSRHTFTVEVSCRGRVPSISSS